MPPHYRSVTDTARRLGLSVAWVRRLAQRGDIPGVLRIGRTWAIPTGWRPAGSPPQKGKRHA